MAVLKVKLLSEENAMSSRFQARIFAASKVDDLPGRKGPWSKWSCLAIDESGDTITISKKFFGEAKTRERAIAQLHSKLPDGVIIDVNPKGNKGKGCKATTRDARYESSTSKVSLEFTDHTEYQVLASSHALHKTIPKRAKIRKTRIL